jgi:hypothetical protein
VLVECRLAYGQVDVTASGQRSRQLEKRQLRTTQVLFFHDQQQTHGDEE